MRRSSYPHPTNPLLTLFSTPTADWLETQNIKRQTEKIRAIRLEMEAELAELDRREQAREAA